MMSIQFGGGNGRDGKDNGRGENNIYNYHQPGNHGHQNSHSSNVVALEETNLTTRDTYDVAQRKPRLRWTTELNYRFVDAVTQLGGFEKATPKKILRIIGVEGLTRFQVKSYLQKFRKDKQAKNKAIYNYKYGFAAQTQTQYKGSFPMARTSVVQQEVQMNDQRKQLNEQEVQRCLQFRIEAEAKYYNSLVETAVKMTNDQAVSPFGLEAANNLASLEEIMNIFNV